MSLYCMKCKRHVIVLLYHYALVIVVEEIVGVTTSTQQHYDGDHDDALEMEIKSTI